MSLGLSTRLPAETNESGDIVISFDSADYYKDFNKKDHAGFWETTSAYPHCIECDLKARETVFSYFLAAGEFGTDSTERMPRDWETARFG